MDPLCHVGQLLLLHRGCEHARTSHMCWSSEPPMANQTDRGWSKIQKPRGGYLKNRTERLKHHHISHRRNSRIRDWENRTTGEQEGN
uniref:Uncharacterized protein n=1 Tax=Arundo donax TaxID=35708 RepID=A0A0A8Y2L8_ARUDO